MLFKNPILKDAVIARRVRARALARSKRIEFASLFPPKTCFQVGKRKRRAGHDWFANRQERGRKTGKIRSYNAPLPPLLLPLHAPDVLNVVARCPSRHRAILQQQQVSMRGPDVTHQMSRGRVCTRIVANQHLWKRAETSRSIVSGLRSSSKGATCRFSTRGLERVLDGRQVTEQVRVSSIFFFFFLRGF